MSIAFSYDFVREAILALSSAHLQDSISNPADTKDPQYYQTRAIHGLQKTINNFSRDSADAALATSLLLAWWTPTL
jgi:hypothetical protein